MWVENADQSSLLNSEHIVSIEVVPDTLGAEVKASMSNGDNYHILFRGTYNQAVAFVRNLERVLRMNFN